MQLIKNSIDQDWSDLIDKLEAFLGIRPADLNGVLFLIGVQELGQAAKPTLAPHISIFSYSPAKK